MRVVFREPGILPMARGGRLLYRLLRVGTTRVGVRQAEERSMARHGYQPEGHILVNGEWVMTYSTPYGTVVTEDGSPARSEFEGTVYVRTVVVDGVRYDERVDPRTGQPAFYGPDGAEASIDTTAAEALCGPGRIVVVDGATLRGYPNEHGTETWVDSDGNTVPGPTPDQEGGLPEVRGYATYEGHRAVVAVDADGERHLYTIGGEPIDRDVDWSQVAATADPGYTGDPIAIGDYTFDGGQVQRVYLFPNGAQAVRGRDGEWDAVIVPTEATYPAGHPVFEGTFPAGVAGDADGAALQTFAFADGQTALMVDGELMLVPTGLDVDYPDGPPVNCGEFPGGDLYVFPDGRQLLLHEDGTWGIPDFPSIPPYEELQATYGTTAEDPLDPLDQLAALDGDAASPEGVDSLGLPLDGLATHDLGIGGLAGVPPADDPFEPDDDVADGVPPALDTALADIALDDHESVVPGHDPFGHDPLHLGTDDGFVDVADDGLDVDGLV